MSDLGTPKSGSAMYPMLWLSICFIAGIIIAKSVTVGWGIYLGVSFTCAIATCLFFKRQFAIIFLSISFISAGAVHISIEDRNPPADRIKSLYDSAQIASGDPVEIEGVLTKAPESMVGGSFVFLKTDRVTYKGEKFGVSGNVRLFTPIPNEVISAEYQELNLRYGSKIVAACELEREDNFLNLGVALRKEILDQQLIDATCTVKSPLLIEKMSDARSVFDFEGSIYRIRQNVIQEFNETFDHQTSAVLVASLLGNKYFLDKQTAEVFREGGTFHVLVISGLHITFIGGLLLFIVRIFTKRRSIQFIAATSVLWTYALAVGAEVPVIRASIMFTILLFPFVIHRKGTILNSLGASILILLVWRPEDIFGQSFLLTITSVTGIVAMAFPLIEKMRAIGSWAPTVETPFPPNVPNYLKRICEMIYWREEVWKRDISRQIWSARLFKSPYLPAIARKGFQNSFRYVTEGIVVSLVVQIWLLPLLIVFFNRLPLFGVILNLWAGANLVLESFSAVFAVMLKQINFSLATPFIKLTEFFNFALMTVPQVLIDLDIASQRIPVYAGNFRSIYLVYFIPLITITVLLNTWSPFAVARGTFHAKWRKWAYASAGCTILLGCLIIFHPWSSPAPDGLLQIDFIDVGQGDSALVTFPNGQTMLVDGGGRMNFGKVYLKDGDYEDSTEIFEPDTQSIGEAVVSKFLWTKGYSKIDYILATHADADHIQGLTDVANNFSVGTALFGRTPFENEEFARLQSVLTKRKIRSETIRRGDSINIGGVRVEVLFPESGDSSVKNSDNNNSVVLLLTYRNRKFMLTGDIEKETESLLTLNTLLEAGVVKVGHHGSRTSSIAEFVSATKADYAIISVGRKSNFGHPHPEVVERWRSAGAKVLTTGERGTISISTDGVVLRVDTFLK